VSDLFSQDFDMFRPKLPLADVSWIHRNLASLVTSGLRLPVACELIADQRPGKRAARVMTHIRLDLESGMGVGEAFVRQKRQLGQVPTSMIQAGELAGAVVPAFKAVITLCDAQIRLRKNLRRAISYPLIVLFSTTAVLLGMVFFVVPRFVELFSELNTPLPALTQIVVDISITLTRQAWAFPASLILLVSLVALVRQLPTGRAITDRLILKLPRLGPLIHRTITARSAATLSALLVARVPMLDSLEMTGAASGNAVFEDAFLDIQELIAQGESVTDSFASVDQLPLILRELAAVGDATGDLGGVLNQYAIDTEEDLKHDGEAFGKTIEPILILFLGCIVGTTVIALYLPIFQLVRAVG
jgi:type IV pilus assembly protein PilC